MGSRAVAEVHLEWGQVMLSPGTLPFPEPALGRTPLVPAPGLNILSVILTFANLVLP